MTGITREVMVSVEREEAVIDTGILPEMRGVARAAVKVGEVRRIGAIGRMTTLTCAAQTAEISPRSVAARARDAVRLGEREETMIDGGVAPAGGLVAGSTVLTSEMLWRWPFVFVTAHAERLERGEISAGSVAVDAVQVVGELEREEIVIDRPFPAIDIMAALAGTLVMDRRGIVAVTRHAIRRDRAQGLVGRVAAFASYTVVAADELESMGGSRRFNLARGKNEDQEQGAMYQHGCTLAWYSRVVQSLWGNKSESARRDR